MKTRKFAITLVVATASLFLTPGAMAMYEFSKAAPKDSVEICVARIAEQANYSNAGRVRHQVETRERRVSGHTMTIDTIVFDADDGRAVREYKTICAISDDREVKFFKLRAKGA